MDKKIYKEFTTAKWHNYQIVWYPAAWEKIVWIMYRTAKLKKQVRWYRFKNMDDFLAYADKQTDYVIERDERLIADKVRRQKERKQARKENISKYKKWDIIVNSRGYNMTHADAYQIVEKKWAKVIIKRVATEVVSWDAWYTGNCKPVKDAFLKDEKEETKMIWARWLSFQFWGSDLWDWKRSYYFNYID